MTRNTGRAATTSWPPALALSVSAFYFNALVCLAAWALLPALAGFAPTVIVSGSMGPSIQAGDVVLTSPPTRAADVGDVVSFRDRAVDRLVTHRVVGVEPNGSYRTRGDANASADSTPVPPEDVVGLGRAVVPAVGLPLHWVRAGEWLPLAAWAVGTAIAWACLDRLRRRPAAMTWSVSAVQRPTRAARGAVGAASPSVEDGAAAHEGVAFDAAVEGAAIATARRPLARIVSGTAVVAILAVVAGLTFASPADAAFRATTANPANTLQASSQFCTPSTTVLTPTADARVVSGSSTNEGAALTLGVRSASSVTRSLLQFALPQVGSCVVTGATLRLHTTAGTTGRTIRALATSATFNESTVVYINQPATTGTSTTAASVATGSWLQIDVRSQVGAIRAGSAYGFSIRDAFEGFGTAAQTFSSREAATHRPELVLALSAVAVPNAPTGLSASPASSTRVDLTWTDASTDETGFNVQRAEAGTGAWATVGSPGAGTASYADTGLQPSTGYDYRVRAESPGGVSPWSNVATATTPATPTPPAAPSGLTATAIGVDRIDLSWTDNASDEDGFELDRSPAGAGSWTAVATVPATTHSDTGRTNGTAYDYRVRAVNGGGASAWSAVVTGTTASCATLPPQTLISVGDSLVLESDPSTPYGADPTYFGVRSYAYGDGRSLVRFGTPTISGGCAVTGATLRAYATAAVAGRTLQALKVATSWTEAAVTWSNQPASTGTAVTTTSGTGWRTWDVTSMVGTAGTGVPNGVLIRDAAENSGSALDNYFSPREGSNPPQLVVSFG